MANKPLTPDERDRILELHAAGQSRNAICRELGRSSGAVTKVVHDAGLSFERSAEVQAATQARQVDNRAKRADMIARLYDQAGTVLDRLAADRFTTVGYSRDGNAVTTLLAQNETPPADVRSLSSTAVNLLQACARLEQVDAAATAGAEGQGILGRLDAAFRAAYADLPDTEDDQGAEDDAEG